jgi:hypothetical protein
MGKYERIEKDIAYNNYNWDQQVDIILVIWAHSMNFSYYQKVGLDWKKLPIQLQMVNYSGLDRCGPTYKSDTHLRYFGSVKWTDPIVPSIKSLKIKLNNLPKHLSEFVTWWTRREPPFLREMIKSNYQPPFLGGTRKISGNPPDTYQLFCAHFSFDYRTPDGVRAKGVRPFSSDVETYPDYYNYSIVKIQTAENSGLYIDKSIGPDGELELKFQAPKDNKSGVPWAKLAKEDDDDETIEKWIKDYTTKADAYVSLFKKKK